MTAMYSRIFYRPSTSVPFPPEPTNLAEHISTNYANKCLIWRDTVLSDDELTKTYKSTWINLEELELAKQDVLLINYAQSTEQYCQENQIVSFTTTE